MKYSDPVDNDPTPVHLEHPADGLPMCATEDAEIVTTTDPALVTCTLCIDAD